MDSRTFEGVVDRYNGVTVDSQKEPCDTSQFLTKLTDSIQKWTEEKKRCIWYKVNIKDAVLVPLLAKEDFNFHHSRENFVMMYRWLPTDSPANLPPACHTNLGVGGLVMNDKNQILVVVEKHTEISHWKLPGGYVERGEDIKDAAIREVKEETGIDAEFDTLVTFRHAHNMGYGNSDIYVVVLLKAISEVINKSEIEIKECRWMDIDEYMNNPEVLELNRVFVRQAINLKNKKLKFNLINTTVHVGKISRDVTTLTVEDSS